MQRNCIFPGRYAPLTYYDWLRGASRNSCTLMERNAREICNFFAHYHSARHSRAKNFSVHIPIFPQIVHLKKMAMMYHNQ